jgi:hypothetical protein
MPLRWMAQYINQDWAQMSRSQFPESVRPAFPAEQMIPVDSTSTTDEAIEHMSSALENNPPEIILKSESINRLEATEIESLLESSESIGVHVDLLSESQVLSPRDGLLQ